MCVYKYYGTFNSIIFTVGTNAIKVTAMIQYLNLGGRQYMSETCMSRFSKKNRTEEISDDVH